MLIKQMPKMPEMRFYVDHQSLENFIFYLTFDRTKIFGSYSDQT